MNVFWYGDPCGEMTVWDDLSFFLQNLNSSGFGISPPPTFNGIILALLQDKILQQNAPDSTFRSATDVLTNEVAREDRKNMFRNPAPCTNNRSHSTDAYSSGWNFVELLGFSEAKPTLHVGDWIFSGLNSTVWRQWRWFQTSGGTKPHCLL